MKKTTRNLLIMLAVLLVLGAGAAALLLLPQDAGEDISSADSSESSSETETVVALDAAQVSSVSVENSQGRFVIVPQDDTFTIEGYEDSIVNTMTVENTVHALTALTANRSLGSRDDLEAFGLAGENAVRVDIRLKEGGAQSLVLGISAGETSGRYVLKDGTVYIVPGLPENLYGGMYNYFSTALYSIDTKVSDDDPNAYDILYHLKLSGANFPEPVEIVYDPSYLGMYLMKTPILAESGTTPMLAIRDALLAPTATAVAAVKLTPEDLEAFGLAEPAATVEFDLNNTQHKMSVSAVKNGARYLMLDDRDAVYLVQDSTVSAWADATLMQLRMSYIWLANISSVKELNILQNGDLGLAHFYITRELNEEKSTETSPSYDLTVTDGSGNAIDYKAYQSFYSDLISIAVLNVDPAEYSGAPAYKVVYSFFDEEDPDVVEFYPVGSDRYAAVLNGGFTGQVRRNETDKAFSALEELMGG